MAKYDIIGSGASLYDDWGKNMGDGSKGYRINGNNVERLASDGKYYCTKALGEPIKNLYWTKKGDVYALTESGKMVYSGILPPDPNAGYKVISQEIGGTQEDERKKNKTEKVSKKTSSKKHLQKKHLYGYGPLK